MSELLSRQSLARWRTESCLGASGWRSEERRRSRYENRPIKDAGTQTHPAAVYTEEQIHFLLGVFVWC